MRISRLFVITVLIAVVSLAASAQTVTAQIGFPQYVQGVAANPITNHIYAVVSSQTSTADTLAVIDGYSDTVLTDISVPAGAYLPAVNILNNRIYIATCNYLVSPTPCSVTVVDGYSNSVIATIPVTTTPGGGLLGIAVDPVTSKVYVANASDHVIDIISGFSNKINGTIDLSGASPQGLSINPVTQRLYVTLGTNQVEIVNTRTKTIVGTTSVGTTNYNAAVNVVTGRVFVPDTQYDNATTGVLSANGSVLARVAVTANPWGVDVDPITNLAFVANTDFNTLTAIDGRTNTATAASPIANVPAFFVTVNSVTEKVYVSGGQYITVLRER